MKHLLSVLALSICGLTSVAHAADATCDAQAAEKKLNGAAKNSFVKKCEKDMKASAAATCDTQAADKKLNGAAKNSFVKKCVKDSGGKA